MEINSIEKLVCEPIESAKRLEFDLDLNHLLFNLVRISIENVEVPKEIIDDIDKSTHLRKLILKRIEKSGLYQYRIDDYLSVFLTALAETPGKAVIYLAYLQYYLFKKVGEKDYCISLIEFSSQIFPNGFPSNEVLNSVWSAQKIKFDINRGSDNLLDFKDAYKSIML